MKQDHRTYSRPVLDRLLAEQRRKLRKEAVEVFNIAICEALVGEGFTDGEQLKRILQSINGIFDSVLSQTLTRTDIIEDIRINTGLDLDTLLSADADKS